MSSKGHLKGVSVWIWLVACSAPVLATGFDTPLDKQEVKTKKQKAKVSCYYFDQFMIKQVDAGEKGAEQLSMIPFQKDTFKPLCRKELAPGEVVVPQGPQSRAGYFKGVVSHYVFFDDADGVNGALGFSTFDALTGKQVFQDFAEGALDFTVISSETVRMRYRRAYSAPCSMVLEGASCWAEIQKATHLPNRPRPDCVKGYKTAKQRLAQARCQATAASDTGCVAREMKRLADWDKSASVLSYSVEVPDLAQPVIKPLEGPLSCWPVD